jgi:hypothetical protein
MMDPVYKNGADALQAATYCQLPGVASPTGAHDLSKYWFCILWTAFCFHFVLSVR